MDKLDVAVIGGGQAGLGIGYYLQAADRRFVIFERGRVGESWRTQRWDSFVVNTPNWLNALPGVRYEGSDPDGFQGRDELVGDFERYADRWNLPIREGVTVDRVVAEDDRFRVTFHDDTAAGSVVAANVVVASGMMQAPKIPKISERFPETLLQLHASDYRSPDALPSGGVVVVGAGQSGCQIAIDLLSAGREVFLSTSKVGRVRRRYRNRDILAWATDIGFWESTVDDLPDPAMKFAAQPQVSGVGRLGSTVSLQSLSHDGVRLMGRLADVVDGILVTDDSLAENIAFADTVSAEFTGPIDEWIASNGLAVEPIEDDPADEPALAEVARGGLTELDLADVGAVVWCTGFTADFGWVPSQVTDETGVPVHTRGVSSIPGLYFLGFPWLHSRKSGIIHGIDEDARFIADNIAARG